MRNAAFPMVPAAAVAPVSMAPISVAPVSVAPRDGRAGETRDLLPSSTVRPTGPFERIGAFSDQHLGI